MQVWFELTENATSFHSTYSLSESKLSAEDKYLIKTNYYAVLTANKAAMFYS